MKHQETMLNTLIKENKLNGFSDKEIGVDHVCSGLETTMKADTFAMSDVEKNITFYSNCEHHFVPIIGKAHIAYISTGKVFGLSKNNRIVQYYAKRPQVQERLTNQIAAELSIILETKDIAVLIDAKHLCVSSRGIKDDTSDTVTSFYGGVFNTPNKITELQNYLK